jgi:hypothetical protein
MVLVSPRPVPRERVRVLLDCLAAGLNPLEASRAAGVSKTFAYELRNKMGGVCRPPGVTSTRPVRSDDERCPYAGLLNA